MRPLQFFREHRRSIVSFASYSEVSSKTHQGLSSMRTHFVIRSYFFFDLNRAGQRHPTTFSTETASMPYTCFRGRYLRGSRGPILGAADSNDLEI